MFTRPPKKSYACLVGAALFALCAMATAQDFAPPKPCRLAMGVSALTSSLANQGAVMTAERCSILTT